MGTEVCRYTETLNTCLFSKSFPPTIVECRGRPSPCDPAIRNVTSEMTTKPKYETIEHTADIGIRVQAPTLAELFANAAYGMFDLICNAESIRGEIEQPITVTANDPEELMVNWLGELLFMFETQKLLFSEFDVTEIDNRHLQATVRGEEYSPDRHELDHGIKAVTYYGLEIGRENSNWTAAVVFDV